MRSRRFSALRGIYRANVHPMCTGRHACEHAWITGKQVDGDFVACDTAMLNKFFRDYNSAHTRGGTNTEQRNLRNLFTWLEAEYDHPHPYTDGPNPVARRFEALRDAARLPVGRCL
jgi:hypothetical protein